MDNGYLVRRFIGTTRRFLLFVVLISLFLLIGVASVYLVYGRDEDKTILPSNAVLPETGGSEIGSSFDQKLTVNAQLQVNGQFYLAPSQLPDDAQAGTLVFDQATSTMQYFNGTDFISLTAQQPVPPAGVTSLQGQAGAINLVAGSGISINGTTISANAAGLTAVSGTLGHVNVITAGGIATISLPQSIAPTAAPTFAGMTLNGDLSFGSTATIFGNNLSKTAPGQDLSISAGTDNIIFTSGGQVYQFPAMAGSPQTICTTTTGCPGGGGGSFIELAPVNAQSDSSGNPTIFVNDTGGGNLLQLQSGGVDRITVATNGNVSISGALTLGSALSVANGGTGATTLTQNGVLYGNGTGAIQAVGPGSTGQCLIATTGSAPSWGACPGAGGIASLTLAGTSGTPQTISDGNTITIAAGTNITTTAGATDTVTIATVASPNFTSLTLSTALGFASGGTNATTQQGAINNLSGLTTNGDILYHNGTNATRLARGTNGQCLLSNGTTIQWSTCTGAGGVSSVNTFSGAITVQGTTNQIIVNNNSGVITLSTPQDINTSSSPTFAALTLGSALTIANGGTGAATQQGAINNLSGLTTNGDLLYHNGTNSMRLARGTNGQCLLSNGTTIQWDTCTGDGVGITSLGGQTGSVQTFANDTNVTIGSAGNVHTLSWAGTLSVARGGTGANNAADARTNLGVAASGANSDITSLSGLTTPLSVAQGGTGANTAQGAIDNLSGLTTNGDLLYHNGTNAIRLARGTNGQCLLSNGSTIEWATCTGDGVGMTGFTLQGSSGTPQSIGDGETVTIAAGDGITSTAGATDTVTVAVDATVCRTTGNCAGVGGVGDIINGGQNGVVTIGTNDANALNFETDGITRMTLQAGGDIALDTNTLYVDATNNRVGVGTSTTTNGLLTVAGAPVNGQILNVSGSSTVVTGGNQYGSYSQLTANPGSASGDVYIGSMGYAFSSNATNMNSAWLVGIRGQIGYNSSGTLNYAVGLNSTGTLNNGGTTNYYRSVMAGAPSILGGSVIGNYAGVIAQLTNTSNTSNQVGLLVTDNIFSQPAGDWAIYSSVTDASYLAGALTTDGLITANGGLTVEAGDTFTFNSDSFTDLTGTGLVVVGNALQTTLGVDINLASSEVTGTLAVGNGGTGAATFTQYGVLFGNGTGAIQATAAGTTGQCMLATTGAAPAWGTCTGDGVGVTTIGVLDSQAPSADGAVITGTSLVLQSASVSVPGLINTTTQSFAGEKTFTDNLNVDTAFFNVSDTDGDNFTFGEFGNGAGTVDLLMSGGNFAQQNLRIFGDDGGNGFNINSFSVFANTTTLTGALQVGGLATINGGLTMQAGDTFNFNSDAFTDLTGDGLQVSTGALGVNATVCRTSGNCAGVGGVGDILQGGNSFTAAMTIGTNDSFALNFETAGATRATIEADGDVVFDTNTMFVDATNNRVGVGTTTPTTEFEVVGDITSTGTKWTSRTAVESNNWISVTYGNSLFVAVSVDGTNRVMTSPDGINWTARTAAAAQTWNSITYANGMFVAVSSDGTNRVMTSPDGINWTARTAAAAQAWVSVTYGNGLFVAVSADGTNRVMTSPDGINWTMRTAATVSQWLSVTYGNGMFVAVAQTGTNRVMTSPDGINWTPGTATAAEAWRVTYGNGLFVAVSFSGSVMTSPNGATWTARTAAAPNQWAAITYGNGLFVALSRNGTNRVMTSPDGINWTARTISSSTWNSAVYGNGMFVAVANSIQVATSGKSNMNIPSYNNIYQGGMRVNGTAIFNSAANSTSSFQIQDSAGISLFTTDTTNSIVTIGTADTTGTLLVLDTKTDAGDPTGVDGGMYYNSNANVFRFYQNGAWVGLGAGDIINGGNTGAVTIGTNNATSLILETNNVARLTVDSSGNAVLSGTLSVPGSGTDSQRFGDSADASGNFSVAVGQQAEATGQGATALGRASSASDSDATAIGYQAIASWQNTTALGSGALASGLHATAVGSYTESEGNYSLAVGAFASAGDEGAIAIGYGVTASGNYSLNIAGILQSSNYQTGNLQIGTSDTTGQLFVLDTKTSAGDPTGVNGGMYYNSNANAFRFYQNGAWVSLGSGDILNGGNTGAITIGTNDANTLTLETNNQPALTIASGGAVTLQNATDSNSAFRVTNAAGNWDGIRVDTTNRLVGIGMPSWMLPLDPTGAGTSLWGEAGDSQEVATSILGRVNGRSTGNQKGIYLESYRDEVLSASAWQYTGTQIRNWGHDLTATTSGAYFFGTDMEHSLWGASGEATHATNMRLRGSYGAQIGSVYGLDAYNEINGTVTNNRSINVGGTYGSGTVTNNYGIYLENQTMGTNDYGIYIQGADTYALWVDDGATRLDGSLTVNTDNLFVDASSGKIGIGTASPSSSTGRLHVSGTSADVANGTTSLVVASLNSSTNNQSGSWVYTTVNPGAASSQLYYGSYSQILSSNSTNMTAALIAGSYSLAGYSGTGTLGYAEGARVRVQNTSTGTISNATGLAVYSLSNSSGTVTNNYGINIAAQTAGLNNIGLYVAGASGGAGLNYALWVDSGITRLDGDLMVDNIKPTGNLTIGTSDATASLLVLDHQTGSSSDPTGVAGGMYYNAQTDRLRVYRNGAGWQNIGDITQGGNTYTTNLILGTNDANSLILETNNTTALTINTSQNATFAGTVALTLGSATGGQTDLCRDNTSGVVRACTSLLQYKDNIADLSATMGGLDTINQLQPRTFTWKGDGSASYGFIAEEVAGVNSLLGQYDGDGNLSGVLYKEMTALLVLGVQELDLSVKDIETRLLAVEQGNFAGNITVGGKIITAGDPAAAVLGAQATPSGTIAISGNDTAGTVTYTAGVSGMTAGEQIKVSFSSPYGAQPRVTLTPTSPEAAQVRFYVSRTINGFEIFFIDTPAAGATYSFDYQVIQ